MSPRMRSWAVPFDKENEAVSKTLDTRMTIIAWRRWPRRWVIRKITRGSCEARDGLPEYLRSEHRVDARSRLGGQWRTPFDPHAYEERGDITEGTSIQVFVVLPQDVPGLIARCLADAKNSSRSLMRCSRLKKQTQHRSGRHSKVASGNTGTATSPVIM